MGDVIETSADVAPASRSTVAPARFEPDQVRVEEGRKMARELYGLTLPAGYTSDGSAYKAFGLDRLYANEAEDFSKRVLGVVGAPIERLFGYRFSKEDGDEIKGAVGKEYPPAIDNPDFRLDKAQVLITTLRAASDLLGPKVVKEAKDDAAAIGLEEIGDQVLKQGWASFFMGVASGVADRLTNGPDVVSEREGVEGLKEVISGVMDEEEKKKGEDIKRNIEYGLELRQKTAKSLREFSGAVWRN